MRLMMASPKESQIIIIFNIGGKQDKIRHLSENTERVFLLKALLTFEISSWIRFRQRKQDTGGLSKQQ
jgi:hypothetical protein